jgi:hypothetical protein
MSVYLRPVVRDRPEHQGQVQRVRPRGPRFVEHSVAADALDAHARRAPGPEPPRNPWLHPRRQVISSGEITSRKLKKDQGDPPTAS